MHWYIPRSPSTRDRTVRLVLEPDTPNSTLSDGTSSWSLCSHTHSRGRVPEDEQVTVKFREALVETSENDVVISGGTRQKTVRHTLQHANGYVKAAADWGAAEIEYLM